MPLVLVLTQAQIQSLLVCKHQLHAVAAPVGQNVKRHHRSRLGNFRGKKKWRPARKGRHSKIRSFLLAVAMVNSTSTRQKHTHTHTHTNKHTIIYIDKQNKYN